MGSGKTSVGRLVAKRTAWPYVDNDEILLELVGKTPRELLSEDGETALRQSESAALRLGLATPEPSIVSAAGGTILDPQNRRNMREAGLVVWLNASPATIEQRATGAVHRAWLNTGGLSGFAMPWRSGILCTHRLRTSSWMWTVDHPGTWPATF